MVYIHGGFLTYGSSGSSPINEEEREEEEDEQEQINWLKAKPNAKLASGKYRTTIFFKTK